MLVQFNELLTEMPNKYRFLFFLRYRTFLHKEIPGIT